MRTCEWIIFTEDGSEWCGKPCEGNNSLCATHSRLSRKMVSDAEKEAVKIDATLARAKIKNQQKRKPINKVSAKREEENKEYTALRARFLIENPVCQIHANDFCTAEATTVHHSAGRIGALFLDVTKWKGACMLCHQYAHDHPLEAIQKGWSESRLAKEKQTI